jgi:hypothetical protein
MQQVIKYFNGEVLQCTIGIVISIASIGASLFFLFKIKTDFYKGMAYVFILISGLLLIICIGVVLRTSKDVERVSGFVQHESIKISTHEIPRMNTVMQNFKIIKIVEACLIIIGLCLLFLSPSGTLWKGIGLGLLIQATMMLTFDIVAANRGKVYLESLHKITYSETRQ